MPLFKVSTTESNKAVLVKANDISELKEKAEEKFKIKIDKFLRKQDEAEVEDDEVLKHLSKNESEVWLIALPISIQNGKTVRVSTLNLNRSTLLSACSLSSLKINADKEFKIKAEKFVRKSDGIEIDGDDILDELIDSDRDLCLIALQADEEYEINAFKFENHEINKSAKKNMNDDNDERNYFLDEYDNLESQIKEFKDDLVLMKSNQPSVSVLKTIEIEKKRKDLEEKLKIAEAKKKQLEELEAMNTTLQCLGMENDKLESKINTRTQINTIEIEKKKKEIEEQLRKEEEKKGAKKKQLDELKTMDTEVKYLKLQREEIEKKYNEKLFETQATREVTKTELDKAEAKLLELKLKQKKIANIFVDLKKAEKVDICFMLDCTGSMGSYINEAKTVIHRIIDNLKSKFQNFELRAAFVGYRDHCDGDKRITSFAFSSNIDNFKTFVSNVVATGGGDAPEDVFGGLKEVTRMDWLNMSKVLFHIADAPAHGNRFHEGLHDDYPDGDPRGLKITDLMKFIANKNINYYFAEINKSTVKMINEFDVELVSLNGEKISVLSLASVDGLTDLVTKSIITTITKSKSISMHSTHGKTLKTIRVDPASLDWSKAKMKKYKADYYSAKYTGTLDEIKSKSIEFEKKPVEIYIQEKPFAKGSIRFAYAGLLNGHVKSVLKQSAFTDAESNSMKCIKEQIENQVISAYLAEKFFNEVKTEKSIRFIDVSMIHIVEEGLYFCIEPFIPGEFKKWMNNAGVINEDIYSCTLDAFSHWSYQKTSEYLIVTDLQGMNIDNKEYILTDPAISCPESPFRFSSTNLGLKGVQKFFETHSCNHLCKHLKLKKHKYQKKDDRSVNKMMTKLNEE